MTAGELIKLLNRCPQDWLVMYDAKTHLDNEQQHLVIEMNQPCEEYSMSIDDVLIGGGTTRGFVYLTAEPYPQEV